MDTLRDPYFQPPNVRINRVYTRRGDSGDTRLAGGQHVPKDSPRLEAYGTIDELNAAVGVARASAGRRPELAELAAVLLRTQHELFNLGSALATLPDDMRPRQPRVTAADVARLEAEMDRLTAALPELTSFVLPGGNRLNAELHLCRTICRRAERASVALARTEPLPPDAVRYLNRLGDAFFVWSRWACQLTGTPETLWDPNHRASEPPGDRDSGIPYP